MAGSVRLPISNVPMGNAFTGVITVGANPLTVLLDTGSSTLVVDGHAFDPLASPGARTTNLAQTVTYGAGSWVGAVVQAQVALSADVVLSAAPLAVTYSESPNIFGGAQGIVGLAYTPLDAAYVMPGDTWATKYTPAQLVTGAPTDAEPYFTQLEETGVVGNKFAFAIQRAAASLATADPASDPANAGVLVIGAGEEATDLYVGDFADVEVVDDVWYNANLLGVQVGDQHLIPVAPLPPTNPSGSNAIVDSGTSCLLFDQPLHDAIVGAFAAIDPAFATMLTSYAIGAGPSVANAQLDLARWPVLRLVFQGLAGAHATIAIEASSYWQLDAAGAGQAVNFLIGAPQGGRSILGLPLFCGRYVVFDRSMDGGRGLIRFAAQAATSSSSANTKS